MLSEEKINELIEKEIRDQVTAKLKQIGRQTMTNLYKEVMQQQVQEFLYQKQQETVNELNAHINVNKDYWKKEVLESIKESFKHKIDSVFDDYPRY